MATAASSPAVSPVAAQVVGDVFIVTKGAQNFKLGLVDVHFIREADFLVALSPKVDAAVLRVAKLREEVEHRKAVAPHMLVMAKGLDKSQITKKTLELTATLRPADLGTAQREHDEAVRDNQKEMAKYWDQQKKIKSALAELETYESGCAFAQGLPPPALAAKTDADGKFTGSLLPGRYAAVAEAHRAVGKETENYCWLVWITMTGEAEKRLMLANDNLVPTACADCIVPIKKVLRSPAAGGTQPP